MARGAGGTGRARATDEAGRGRSNRAALLLFAVSGSLLLGALGFQHLGGLAPCEMCYWQRYAHVAVVVIAALAMLTRQRALTLIAILAMAVAAGLGLYHAGVELQWWQGMTACTAPPATGGNLFEDMLGKPLVRCDQIPWSLFGISMAGWNAIISALAAIVALRLWKKA